MSWSTQQCRSAKVIQKLLIVFLTLILCAVTTTANPTEKISSKNEKEIDAQSNRVIHTSNQLVIKFTNQLTEDSVLNEVFSALPQDYLSNIDVHLVNLADEEDPKTLADELNDLDGVDYAQPNYVIDELDPVQGSYPFSDKDKIGSYTNQQAVNSLQLNAAHSIATGSGVTIAVIDGGIDFDHPDLQGKAVSGYDFVDKDTYAFDELGGEVSGHGTFVAGIIHLAAPDATIRAYRVIDENGRGDGFSLAQAIEQAVNDGCDVINLSIVLIHEFSAVYDAIAYARSQDVVVITAAGNKSTNTPVYPGAYSNTLNVVALDSLAQLATFSNYGNHVNVCAPGIAVYSLYNEGGYAWWSGTSFSAPFVTGQIALLKQEKPTASATQLIEAISQSANEIDIINPAYAGQLGEGIVDVITSLSMVHSNETATITPDTVFFELPEGTQWLIMPSMTIFLTSSNAPAAYKMELLPSNTPFVFIDPNQNSGFTNDSMLIAVNPNPGPPGVYYNTVEFHVEGVLDPVELVVVGNVTPAPNGPTAYVDPLISFQAPFGADVILTSKAYLTSTNAPAVYNATVEGGNQSFVSILNPNGMTNDSITITVNPSGLDIGFYTEKITFNVGGVQFPAEMSIYLTVYDGGQATASVSPGILTFAAIEGSTSSITDLVHLSSSNAPAMYTTTVVGGNQSFVSVPDPNGSTNENVTIVADPTGLTPGNYTDSVLFYIIDVPNPVVLPVQLSIAVDSTQVDASISPSALSFTTTENSAPFTVKDAAFLTSDNAPAAYTAVVLGGSQSFVSLESNTGVTSENISLILDPTGLTVGRHTETISFEITDVITSVELLVDLYIQPDSGGGTATSTAYPHSQSIEVPSNTPFDITASVTITSTNAPADYTVSVVGQNDFIVLNNTTGLTNDSIFFQVASAGLDSGIYIDTLLFDVTDAGSAISIVYLAVGGAGSGYGVPSITPISQAFYADSDSPHSENGSIFVSCTKPSQNFTVSILGTSTFTTLLETSGTTDDTISFTVSTGSGLPAGTYIDSIEVDMPGAIPSKKVATLFLVVSDGGTGNATASVTPNMLTFSAVEGSVSTQTNTVDLTSSNAPADYSAAVLGGSQSFVSIPDTSGVTNETISITVDPFGLTAGVYFDTVAFFVTGVTNPVAAVVQFTITSSSDDQSIFLSNHPNPFNPTTVIEYSLPKASHVKLEIFNILGQSVTTLVDERREAGTYSTNWDGTGFASGIYLYRLQTESATEIKKMLLIK